MLLQQLGEDDVLLVVSALDHVSLCRSHAVCKRFRAAASSQYAWKVVFMGALHGESSPLLTAPTDWLGAFKRFINAKWDDQIFDGSSPHAWTPLGRPARPPADSASSAAESPLIGGQDPKMLDIGGGKVLVLGGSVFTDPRGGCDVRAIPEMWLVDTAKLQAAGSPGSGAGADAWEAVAVVGTPPPALYGAYVGCFGDGVLADRALFFGGGTHIASHDLLSCLQLGELLSRKRVRWEPLSGTPELICTWDRDDPFTHGMLPDDPGCAGDRRTRAPPLSRTPLASRVRARSPTPWC